jgi:type I restriction enzyme M protein
VDALQEYWKVYPNLKADLFAPNAREGYWDLKVEKDDIKNSIFSHPDFTAYGQEMEQVFAEWKTKNTPYLKGLEEGCHPKEVIHRIAEDILQTYHGKALVSKYDVYQHLMDYWAETMQDDLYELTAEGWEAGNTVTRLMKKTKKQGKEVKKEIAGLGGLEGSLIPPSLIIQEYLAEEQATLDALHSELDAVVAEMDELAEEHTGEEGLLSDATTDAGSITKGSLSARIKQLGKKDSENAEEWGLLAQYKRLMSKETQLKAEIKKAEQELELKVIKQYPQLSIEEIKELTVDKKWMATMKNRLRTEMDSISHRLTERIKELAERYETPLQKLTEDVSDLKAKVEDHLKQMEYAW